MSSSGVLNTSVSHASDREISSSTHEHEIQRESGLHVMLDHEVMGVGGDNSWEPCVHEKYLVRLSLTPTSHSHVTHTPHTKQQRRSIMLTQSCVSFRAFHLRFFQEFKKLTKKDIECVCVCEREREVS